MKRAALPAIAALMGACGTQTLPFDAPDAGSDAPPGNNGCASDSDCPGLHCSSGQCVACVNDDQCTDPDYRFCDSLNLCVQCVGNDTCPGGGTCEPTSHRCVPSCADGGLCPSGLTCDYGLCVECTSDGGLCPDGLTCDHGQCVQCIDNNDCAYDGVCDPTGRCVECLDDQGCRAGQYCSSFNHVCVDLPGTLPEGGPTPGFDGGGRM